MSTPRRPTPEELYLEKERAQLAELEAQLVERELELETLRGGLLSFERKIEAATVPRYAELDELRANIADLIAARRPDDEAAKAALVASKAAAAKSAARREQLEPKPDARREPSASRPRPMAAPAKEPTKEPAQDFNPTEELKRLYRDVAKAIHPDLSENDDERVTRHAFMIRANEAYEQESAARLAAILHEWHMSPEAVRGEGSGPELVRVIRKIARCQERLVIIEVEINRMQTAGVFGLKLLAEEASKVERDFIAEMTGRLDVEIAQTKAMLERLQKEQALPPQP